MVKRLLFSGIASLLLVSAASAKGDSLMIRKLYDEALLRGQSYENLRQLCKKVGHRLSGSPQAQKAVEMTYSMMKLYCDTVYLQECMVPHWVRGEKETARITGTKKGNINVIILALGGSIATPDKGITAEVVMISDFNELEKLGEKKIKGKIIFYNHPFNNANINTFKSYGECVEYRWAGPARAAKLGAVATVVRSMTGTIDEYPHTGSMRYDSAGIKIPCAAISTRDAELLINILKTEGKANLFMKMNCQTLPDEKSFNVIGEIRGSVNPDQIILVGGHLDSWDVGEGAHDDGAGVVQSMEALRLFKASGIRPKHTLRAVLFMNEENGLRGGTKYAEVVKSKNEKHLAAIETDAGGFTPHGFGMDITDTQFQKATGWAPLLLGFGLHEMSRGGSGADIGPLKKQEVPLFGLHPDSQRYFDFHHTNADVFEAVNKRELELGGAAIAALMYLIDNYGW